jgi:cytochrome c553
MPRLAAQRSDYTEQAMKEFRDSTRSGADALMSNAAVGLSDADIKALTQYIASLAP